MAPPVLEMTVMAAEDLKDVATFGKMDVYAVVWVDPFVKRTTRILHKGGKNPVWNEWITLSLDSVRHCPNAYLTVQIFSESSMGDKVVGTGRLPLHEIYRINPAEVEEPALVTLQLQRPSGRTQGIISLSLRVTGDTLRSMPQFPTAPPVGQLTYGNDKNNGREPVIGIPVPFSGASFYSPGVGTTSTGYPSLSSTGYPALSAVETRDTGSGSQIIPYAYPPTQYQGYPNYYQGQGMNYPPPAPYAYVQPPRPQNRSNGSLLLGLLGGAIGGLILGDIIS